jgi:hypothetical protein
MPIAKLRVHRPLTPSPGIGSTMSGMCLDPNVGMERWCGEKEVIIPIQATQKTLSRPTNGVLKPDESHLSVNS